MPLIFLEEESIHMVCVSGTKKYKNTYKILGGKLKEKDYLEVLCIYVYNTKISLKEKRLGGVN
jgi:hypothetical protein